MVSPGKIVSVASSAADKPLEFGAIVCHTACLPGCLHAYTLDALAPIFLAGLNCIK